MIAPLLLSVIVSTGSVVESGSGVAAVDSPGEQGVRGLYAHLLDKAMEATDVWPKVECSDRVRWCVYPDGTIYLLNTEAHLSQEVLVRRSASAAPERILLKHGEMMSCELGVEGCKLNVEGFNSQLSTPNFQPSALKPLKPLKMI